MGRRAWPRWPDGSAPTPTRRASTSRRSARQGWSSGSVRSARSRAGPGPTTSPRLRHRPRPSGATASSRRSWRPRWRPRRSTRGRPPRALAARSGGEPPRSMQALARPWPPPGSSPTPCRRWGSTRRPTEEGDEVRLDVLQLPLPRGGHRSSGGGLLGAPRPHGGPAREHRRAGAGREPRAARGPQPLRRPPATPLRPCPG